LDAKKFVEEAFKRDSKIRFVGVVDNEFHILFSKMREGVVSVTTEEEEHNFIQLMPPILVDGAEKMQHVLGRVESITIRYEKVLLVFFRIGAVVVVLSYNPDITTPFVSAVSDLIRELGPKYLTP
jgi:hypothetical protein